MAETTPAQGQKLQFEDGTLEVTHSFSAPQGLLHRTVDGGYYFGPNKPLTNDEVPDHLPEPYHTEAHEWITSQAPPPPEGGVMSTTEETTEESPSESSYSGRRRR